MTPDIRRQIAADVLEPVTYLLQSNLTHAESRIVHVLRRAKGEPVSGDEVRRAAGLRSIGGLRVSVCRLRKKRPDLGASVATILRPGGCAYAWRAAE